MSSGSYENSDLLESVNEADLTGFPSLDPTTERILKLHLSLQLARLKLNSAKNAYQSELEISKGLRARLEHKERQLVEREKTHGEYRDFVNQMREVYRRGSQAKTLKMKTWMVRTLAELAVKFFAEEVPF